MIAIVIRGWKNGNGPLDFKDSCQSYVVYACFLHLLNTADLKDCIRLPDLGTIRVTLLDQEVLSSTPMLRIGTPFVILAGSMGNDNEERRTDERAWALNNLLGSLMWRLTRGW